VKDKIVVRVKPNAKRTEILEQDEKGRVMRVAISAPPDKNKANLELVKLLSKKFGKARIVSGFSSRDKIVEIS